MLFFRNDYGEGCIQPILDLLVKANDESNPGYGEDAYSEKARQLIQSKLPDTPSQIHFVVSGTLTNIVMIRQVLRMHEAVICADTGHIMEHEAGAIEASGHKIISVPNVNGKLTASVIEEEVMALRNDSNYLIEPRLVYISNATELGTVYTRKELEDISEVCRRLDLYLMMDGARIGQALMSGVDYSLNDIAKWIDIFSVGGTKNGALFGEAVVVTNKDLQPYFRYIQKQSGALLAKGWLIAMQFIGLFENDDFYKCAGYANELGRLIQDKAIEFGYPLFMRSSTNQIFLLLNQVQFDYLKDKVDFEVWTKWEDDIVIRLVTSWHTRKADVMTLCQYLQLAMDISTNQKVEDEIAADEAARLQEAGSAENTQNKE